MLVLNAEVLFVDSLVFLHVVSVVRGRSSRVEGGRRGWSSPGRLGSGGRKWRGFRQRRLPLSTLASSLMMRAPALMISLELALAAQAPVHDKVQAPSSAPPQPGPPDSPDSGASTAQ